MRKRQMCFAYMWVTSLIFVMLFSSVIPTKAAEDAEDGAIKQHELFEFEAFIKHDDIADGTGPFDGDDQPGNDSSGHNKIVRSWDTVTYPLKITVNPKRADKLEKIKLKISGTLENGITDDRVNANFAIGGSEDMDSGKVSFVQDYTIERTGNSIMVPVTIEVKGAKPGVVLTPDLKVEVESVEGENISGVVTEFHDLPGVTVSAKVNIKPYISHGLSGTGYPHYPYSRLLAGGDEMTGVQAFSVAWGVEKLTGKSDIRGATFPDADGKIGYTIELSGEVYWDNKPAKSGTEYFDFDGRDTPIYFFDHRPIQDVNQTIGSKNTLSDGLPYYFPFADYYAAPRSYMDPLTDAKLKAESFRSVWDSGDWEITKPIQDKRTVTYKGSNTGFRIGSTFPNHYGYTGNLDRYIIYGENDKVFSSHSFLVDVQNEYRIGGRNNPLDYTNNVYYRVKLTLEDYTDPDGNVTTYNKQLNHTFYLRNGTGGMSAYGTYQLYPSKGYVSPKQPYNWNTPVGDGSILTGQDVYFTPRLNPSDTLYGGYKGAYRWNTDAFELTEDYARQAEANILARGYRNLSFDWVQNDTEHQKIYYGVAKFSDNSFENFTSKSIEDYDWYATFKEAVLHGPVGAMLSDVRAPVGGMKGAAVYLPLKVKHDNIGFGSVTKNGTPVIAVVNAHAFLDKGRQKLIDVTKNRSYNNYSEWDSNGNLLKLQRPLGGSVNFDTLAVVPAKTATTIKADKSTYYNSETIHWTAKSSVVLPESGVPNGVDAGVKVTHTLPKGLDYKTGSGAVDGEVAEPSIIKNEDGTTSLVWDLLISNQTRKIPIVTFDTTINPFALSADGVQSSITVKGVIESALDGGPSAARTDTASVTVLKVGMVGIYETIDKIKGEKNSDYTVTLSPYTTIEDEKGVTGLTHLPLSGDDLGSKYAGTAEIKAIELDVERVNEEPVRIYLNRTPVYDLKPQNVDVSQGGWYEYTGNQSEFDGAVSLLFHVEGKMTNKDNINIDVTIQTANNGFGDTYLNETVINSDTDYKLSPVSNRVRYTIRADLELALERFQIFTNKHDEGLPTSIRVAQTVAEPDVVKDKTITLAIYETESGDKVAAKTYKQQDLKRENEIRIPPGVLEKATHKNYEVRIEGYDTNKIWVRDGEGSIDTDGYTAKEGVLTIDDADESGDVRFKGVVMTERELGKDMETYHESWIVKRIPEPTVKSGYGFSFKPTLEYTNDMMSAVRGKISLTHSPEVALDVDHRLIDSSLEYYDETAAYSGDDKVTLGMLREEVPNGVVFTSFYDLPELYLEQGTGLTYTKNQKESGAISGDPLPAGRKLYVPIWIDEVGGYEAKVRSKTSFGSHFMNFDIARNVHVEAYMFNHTDSDTPEDDELLIHPMVQDDIPENW
jgi:hypothetical protein